MIDLIVCSICLRVRRGPEWLDAEDVIRDIKSYDDQLPRLHGAVCSDCADAIARRRAASQDTVRHDSVVLDAVGHDAVAA
jgi:hypothetical protein